MSGAERVCARLLPWTTLLLLCGAAASVWLHRDLARGLTHTAGVFVVLAELLGDGVLYPAEPSLDLVYSCFYHPLAFAPLALLPGDGLTRVPWVRLLVGAEALAALGMVAVLARTRLATWRLAAQPMLWALCTVPVAFSLLGMRDDPRATLFALLAVWAYLRHGRAGATLAGLALALAFFTKATAPAAPALAIALHGWRDRRHDVVAVAATAGVVVAAGIAWMQWGLGADFLGNGLHYALVEPAKPPRDLATWAAVLRRDLTGGLVLLPLAAVSAGWALLRAARRRADLLDLLLLLAWAKTLYAYRSAGTELNHLFDLTLFAALQLAHRVGPWFRARHAVPALLAALLLGPVGQLVRLGDTVLVPPRSPRPLATSPAATIAAALRAMPPQRTLIEIPLVAYEAGLQPVVTDPLLTFATLRDHPEIREAWFGPPETPGALDRIVLMFDPRPGNPENLPGQPVPEEWYGPIHFDAEFLREVRTNWQVLIASGDATVLVRRAP